MSRIPSLRQRMILLLMAFALLVATSVIATFWGIGAQAQDALVINLAGRQRMLVQKMTRKALEIHYGNRLAEDKQELEQTANTFIQTHSALMYGGQAPHLDSEMVRLPAADPRTQEQLKIVDQNWKQFSAAVAGILGSEAGAPELEAHLSAIQRLSPELVNQADDVVHSLEREAENKVRRLRLVQSVFLLGALLLLGVGAVVVQRSVIEPLAGLGAAARRIGQGDLATPVETHGPAEIALLASAFNQMRLDLDASRRETQAWAEELEVRVAQRTQALEALYAVSRDISSRLDLDHVLGQVTAQARQLLDAKVAFLCLLDESRQGLTLSAHDGPPGSVQGVYSSLKNQLTREILNCGSALPCGVDGCAGRCKIIQPAYQISHLAAPLRVGENTIGALCVGSDQPEAFGIEEADLLGKLASAAAVAMENARLYAQAERAAMLEERQRIAADMHDGLAQTLGYLGLTVDQLSASAGPDAPPGNSHVLRQLRQLRAGIDQAAREVRQAIANLQEGPPPPCSLEERIAGIVRELALAHNAEIIWQPAPCTPPVVPADHGEQIAYIVREAALNAIRHGQARQIRVCLDFQGETGVLSIEDDGCGFDPRVSPADGRQHFGLDIMRARAARLNGLLEICSRPGNGTRVELTWPVEFDPN